VSPDTLAFQQVFLGATRVDSVRVVNAGTDDLHISSVTADLAVFTVPGAAFALAPGEFRWLPVRFAPAAPVVSNGTLTIFSDDHDEPALTVRLAGEGLVPPDISASPSLLAADLITGAQAD